MKKQNQLRSLFAAVAAGVMSTLTTSATLDLPAPMPEFMDDAQLETWRTAQIAESNAREAALAAANSGIGNPTSSIVNARPFFTGKPLMEETGEYAFLFRNYNPELARLSNEDPSGFPDGPNNLAYMAVPTSELDWAGLISINGFIYNIYLQYYSQTGSPTGLLPGLKHIQIKNDNFISLSSMSGTNPHVLFLVSGVD